MESTQPPIETTKEVLSLQGISRDYGSLEAVRGISLDIRRSEIHALVGQHGAGKTSLAQIISGMLKPSGGTITFCGKRYGSLSLQHSHRLGIRMVYQQLCLNGNFTVAENLFANDRRVNNFVWNSPRRMNRAAADLLREHRFDIDPAARLGGLSLSDRAVVDILKQVLAEPVLLILDEALEKLTHRSMDGIIRILLGMVARGMSILFITHRIDDVYSFAHRVSIIRDGQLIFTGTTEDIDKINLVRLAYTQFSSQPGGGLASTEFKRFLRYNEAIIVHLPISLLLTDTEDRVILGNRHFERAFGLSSADYQARPMDELFRGMSGVGPEELSTVLRGKQEGQFFNIGLVKNGRASMNNLKTFPVYDEGQHIGSVLVIEDISEYDKMQKKMILSEKLASVGLLAAGVAHEINNPLEIIYNYIAALKKRVQGRDALDTVGKLGEEIAYISSIVNNLVNLGDTDRLADEEIDLTDTISRILDLLRQSAKSRRIRMDFSPSPDPLRTMVNANEVKQVILNLMKNSFEAMPEGGVISVSTARVNEEGLPMAIVRVADEGPGISAENLGDVFLPFYTTKKSTGSNIGLGLSVSYAILERHGGRLMVENLPAGGCSFSMALPLSPNDGPRGP
ncbi:MAG: ATP-binding cassette domain-containing protein [Spirochaetota bacterium]